MIWFFNRTDAGDAVVLRQTMIGDDVIGDCIEWIRAGESAFGLTFEEMAKVEGGTIEVGEDGKGRIATDEEIEAR